MFKKVKNKKAFTLIELLVVILLIGIVAAIALPQFTKLMWRSRVSQLLIASREIWEAQQRHIFFNGERSLDLAVLDISIEGGTYGKAHTSSTTNDRITFNWGGCSISQDFTRSMIICGLKKPPISYARMFNSTGRWCCSTTQTGRELCQEIITNPTSVFDSNSYCGNGGRVYQTYK